MLTRLWGRLTFRLERFVLGGPLNRLFVIAVFIGALAMVGGALVFMFGEHSSVEELTFGEALWWAFLRLSDPGYLGDDTGTFVRIVSTALTVLGYVVFLGSLVAIMTQWLNSSLTRLESGFTPLVLNKHLLILGWSSRTVAIVREIMLSEGRVKRFLRRSGAGRLRVVVLAEEVAPEMIHELRERLGPLWDPGQIILRTGSPLRLEHLRRADFLHAAAILLPSPDSVTGDVEYPDARIIKTILATSKSSRDDGATSMPLMVVELSDAAKLEIAARAYGGQIEAIASDLIVARLLAQNIRHPGTSAVYTQLLKHDLGCEIYLRTFDELEGLPFSDVAPRFPDAIPLGVLRGDGTGCSALLNPGDGLVVQRGDRIVLLAADFDDAVPDPKFSAPDRQPSRTTRFEPLPTATVPTRRVLILGWNHVVPALIRELDGYGNERFEVDVLSQVKKEEREAALARVDAAPRQSRVRQIDGEYTSLVDVANLKPASYHTVLVLSSDRLESEGERDARSILGGLVLQEALAHSASKPSVLVELLDEENVALVEDSGDETLLSPAIMSHLLTQVALHRDLRNVYDELFGPGGAEIFFRPAADYGLTGRSVTFGEIQTLVSERGEIALGVRTHRGARIPEVTLNPSRAATITAGTADEIVVLA